MMKQLFQASVLAFGGIATASAGVDIYVNFGGAPYYGYAPRDVVYVERYVPAPYVPRVFYLSRHARVPPSVIVNHYRAGWGWDRMCRHYRVPAHAVYSPVYVSPPRGKARGHWKHGRDHDWDDGRRYRNGYRR